MVGSHCVHAAISCQDALVALLPCKPFITGGSPSPSALCCKGMSKLNAEASTIKERRELCRCLKDAAPAYRTNHLRSPEFQSEEVRTVGSGGASWSSAR
ncbi:hypothetical protein SLA2020_188490 [Shorea laevis]